jgi:CBS-domain-containing membrane protein
MESGGEDHVPVVENHDSMRLIGIIHQRDVMHAHSKVILGARELTGDDR